MTYETIHVNNGGRSMKANPGGTVTGDAIIGREKEIADI